MLKSLAKHLLVLAGALLLLSACIAPKLPYHETGYGLVAVPYEISNQTTYQLVKAVALKSSRDEAFTIRIDAPPLNDDVVISQPLSAGSYVVDYLEAVSVPVPGVIEKGSRGRENFIEPVRIDIKDGEITLFPMLFSASQYKRADYVVCHISHEDLTAEKQGYYLEKIPAMENGDQWRMGPIP